MDKTKKKERTKIKWQLVVYDLVVMVAAWGFVFGPMHGSSGYTGIELGMNLVAFLLCIMTARGLFFTYNQIWRYGGTEGYMRIIMSEAVGFTVYFFITRFTPIASIPVIRTTAFVTLDCLGVLVMRMSYRFCFKFGNSRTAWGRLLLKLLRVFAGIKGRDRKQDAKHICVAIVGAGNTGVTLAGELNDNKNSVYEARMFIDLDESKVGRYIQGIKVYRESDNLATIMVDNDIQEVIFAVHDMDMQKKKELYAFFSQMGFRIMTYDSPRIDAEDGKSHLREFSVDELLFRRQQTVVDDSTRAYYKDKTILITGGGGSIGSELCRQLATMDPKKLVILDIYENGAYDVQQELRIRYKGKLDLQVEICSITNMSALERVFESYRPQIVINAAAHKHVPLMEHNCIEAIENNVFGCRNVIECCEKYGAERFMMVSTDKAVNPTNVMGATKRMCEMIVQSASTTGKVKYSATRFGNVLGSAGSVIPLFKRQIEQGGPVTVTDRRITRYFMTIPEASQLVLASGAMARNGDLFVLDMGEPVKILDLAQSMIHIMGATNVEIVETGLRPGEKLYEELLVRTEELDKTPNEKIFIEHDAPQKPEQINEALSRLKAACDSGNDDEAREVLRQSVPTYHRPEEVNEQIGK